ncbi:MAG: type II secretion system F family protein [Actinomycetota bacterium]
MSAFPFAAAVASLSSALAVAAIATATPEPALARVGLTGGASPVSSTRVGLRWIGSRFKRQDGRLQGLILEADTSWTVDEVAGAKVLGPLAVLAVALLAPGSLVLLSVPIAIVAFRFPELVLARAARRRRFAASREVPLFLDLLAVTTSAGLPPQLAVRVASEPLRGPLGEELRGAVDRVDLGRRWRDEIAASANRLAQHDLGRAIGLLLRTQRLGTSLADEMSRLAADVREGARLRAVERARTAPVKMLFPLVFLILPAFLLLTVVPVLLTTVRSIG